MRQRPQRKSVLVEIGGFEDQVMHEVTGSNIMSDVAEEFTSEWVVTNVVRQPP